MKKDNTSQKNAIQAEKISKALKEGTEKTLQDIIKEAIGDIIDSEDDEKEEKTDGDSFEVEDVETEETPEETADDATDDSTDADSEGEEGSEEGDADDEWADMEDFKVGDNDYDFTNVDGEMALKVYNKLGNDDEIFVKKEDDGTYSVKDDETGAEFVIELQPDSDEAETPETDDDEELAVDEPDFDEPDEDEEETSGEIELELGADDDDEEDEEEETFDVELDEDLGYTDSYQSKDVIAGLSMKEPADKGATYSMDKGIPDGTKKPWAGKHKEPDYKETGTDLAEGCHEEIEEGATTVSSQSVAKATRTQTSKPRAEHKREVAKELTAAGERIDEGRVRKIVEAAKAVQAENKKYAEAVQNIKQQLNELKKSLFEAAVLNVNYGKIVSLLVNETTTKDEKKGIVERFQKVRTINEGKQLYESIKRELNESNKKVTPIISEQVSANASKTINETTIYSNIADNNPSIDLMRRMDNLFKK